MHNVNEGQILLIFFSNGYVVNYISQVTKTTLTLFHKSNDHIFVNLFLHVLLYSVTLFILS